VGDYKIGNGGACSNLAWRSPSNQAYMSRPGTPGAPRKFHGIGIRIEDDVVVTRDGCEVLTERCPKEAVEIERLMASVA
jgi:Xaa-Pro aminopeptidase